MPTLQQSVSAPRRDRDPGVVDPEPPKNDADRPERWAVVGGGILGMTLAYRLRQAGREVTLYEAADHFGGMADAWKFGGITWDRHYHVTLLSDLNVRELLSELEIEDQMEWAETKTGFYTGGEWFSMSNTLEFLKFPPLGLIDKLRLGGTIFLASKIRNWKRLEKIPVTEWLRRWSGKNTYEKIWLPLLKAKLGENYQKASAAFIWAIIARMYAARQSGLKKEMFGYLSGGYDHFLGRFVEALDEAGVGLRESTLVRSIRRQDDGFNVEMPDRRLEKFDRVAVTLPGPVATRLCPDLAGWEAKAWNEIEYQGIVCVSLLLKRPLKGYYVTNITDPAPFTAIIEMSALVDREKYFDGQSLVYLPKYVSPDDPVFERDDEDIEREFVATLRRMVPDLQPDEIVACRISRVRNVLALSTLNYSEKLPPMATSVPGLHLVNSAHICNGTLNVNETIQLANRAAANLTAAVVSGK